MSCSTSALTVSACRCVAFSNHASTCTLTSTLASSKAAALGWMYLATAFATTRMLRLRVSWSTTVSRRLACLCSWLAYLQRKIPTIWRSDLDRQQVPRMFVCPWYLHGNGMRKTVLIRTRPAVLVTVFYHSTVPVPGEMQETSPGKDARDQSRERCKKPVPTSRRIWHR
jgi:hypothetical protein